MSAAAPAWIGEGEESRFRMTTPLVGRDDDLKALLAALKPPNAGVVLLRGPAGSGKSRLAEAATSRLRADRVLVGLGKYGEGAIQSPLGPITHALSELTDQALEELYDPQAGVAQMTQSLGVDLEVLIQAGFRGGSVQARAPLSALAGRRAGLARLTHAAVKLLHWLSGFGLSMVLVIDDWWRATEEARSLIAALATEGVDLPFAQLLLERDDSGLGPNGYGGRTRVRQLAPLGPEHSLELMRRCLEDDEAGDVVARWFGEHCPRLPFEIIQTARALNESAALTRADGRWAVDDVRAASLGAPALTLGVGRRIRALPAPARDLAIAAALWSDEPPIDGLRVALQLDGPSLNEGVRALVSAGLAVRTAAGALRFNHDRLREEVLRQASEEERRNLARAMANRLAAADPAKGGEAWASAALHLQAAAGLDDADPAVWRDRFARGALAARRRADLDAAVLFSEAAWTLRQRDRGSDAHTDRLLLHEAVLAAADQQNPDAVWERVRLLIDSASGHEALGEAYSTGIVSLELAGQSDRAWDLAAEALRRFRIRVPRRVTRKDLLIAVVQWRLSRRRRVQTGRHEAYADGLTRIGESAATLAFERNPADAGIVALRTSAKAGHSRKRAAFWASVDAFLCSMVGDYAGAARSGELALAKQGEEQGPRAAILYRAYYFGVIWKRPARDIRRFCSDIHDLAVAEGDLACAGNALRNSVTLAWRAGPSLDEVKLHAQEAMRGLVRLGEQPSEGADGFARIGRWRAVQDILLLAESLSAQGDGEPLAYTPLSPILVLERALMLGNWTAAIEQADELRPQRAEFNSHPGGVDWRFHDCLAMLKAGRPLRRADLGFLQRHARLNPVDHGAKPLILQAEQLRQRGRTEACLRAYARAVETADASPSRLEAGLAARCAAEAAAGFGRSELEQRYRARADEIWAGWGAHALLSVRALSLPGTSGETEAGPAGEMAERLIEAEAQATAAERADRAKSRFLATVAHELRTPMQGLQSLLDIAADHPGGLDVEQFREVFASLTTVVDDLADLGAIGGGALPFRHAPTRLRELLDSECAIASPLLPVGSMAMIELEPGLPEVIETDPARLRQLVRNLLTNAVKYGGGSPVCLHVRRAPASASNEDGMLQVRVMDRGPGIPAAELVRIFEPFERGGASGDSQGLGLGLSVARRIAEGLGGRLWAENRAEGGAAFCFTMPGKPVASGFQPSPALGRPRSALKVLLAEDVALTRELIASLLERDGHTVRVAVDGIEALEALSRERFDVCLLDMAMPRAGGADVMAELARRGDSTPVVILSAAAPPEADRSEAQARPIASLRKPVTLADLRRALQQVAADTLRADRADDAGVDMTAFEALADVEVRRLTAELLAMADQAPPASRDAIAFSAHRLAGLALQFGRSELGLEAEALEAAVLNGEPPTLALRRFERAAASADLSRPRAAAGLTAPA